MEVRMMTMFATMQLLAAAGLIFAAVIIGWRAGNKYWSSR
jgi:hypothetical protein